jgi:hypothetical protein
MMKKQANAARRRMRGFVSFGGAGGYLYFSCAEAVFFGLTSQVHHVHGHDVCLVDCGCNAGHSTMTGG